MYFIPKHQPRFYEVLESVKNAALAHAAKLKTEKGINYVVERLKPVHLNLTDYKIPANSDKSYRVNSNVGIFFAGIFSYDTNFDYMRWWEGKKARVVGEWFTLDVAYLQEKEGVYGGNLKYYYFVGDSSFTFYAHSMDPTATSVNAWFIAFVAVPEMERDNPIVTAI